MTGSTPGMPVQISHTLEFGGSPSWPTAHPQNIFVRVRGCTCTSIPMTTSQEAVLITPAHSPTLRASGVKEGLTDRSPQGERETVVHRGATSTFTPLAT